MHPPARLLFRSSWPKGYTWPSHVTKGIKANHLNAAGSVGQNKHLSATRHHAAGHGCNRFAHAGQRTHGHDAQATTTAATWAHHATLGAPGAASCRNGSSSAASTSRPPTDRLVVALTHRLVIPFVNLPSTSPHMNTQQTAGRWPPARTGHADCSISAHPVWRCGQHSTTTTAQRGAQTKTPSGHPRTHPSVATVATTGAFVWHSICSPPSQHPRGRQCK